MANRNDYNYYKNEYGKYKDNYYSPGSEAYKKRKIGSTKQKIGRIFRAFIVFIIIAAIVVGLVFGIIKLSSVIRDKAAEKETTTQSTTTVAETTTKIKDKEESTTEKKPVTDNSKIQEGTKCIVKTEEGNGVYLRRDPTYDISGFTLVPDNTVITVERLSQDGKWCKTSNFDENGWLNLKYLKVIGESTKEETTKKEPETTAKETTTKKPETTTESKTQLDSDVSSYNDAVEIFKNKGSGTSMNCKIVAGEMIGATYKPDASSQTMVYVFPGESVKVVEVQGNYSRIIKTGYESTKAWVPNANLSFVSWG